MYRSCSLHINLEQHILPCVQMISDHFARLAIPIAMDISVLNQFIALDKLSVSPANMRHGRHDPDISDLLPTVRARGILQSLIVRPTDVVDCFEILAGRRRFHAARAVAAESGVADPVPSAGE